jgi:hypothetical protein
MYFARRGLVSDLEQQAKQAVAPEIDYELQVF